MNIRETILASDDIKKEKVSIPEWGVDVFIKVMSGYERDTWETETIANRDKTDRNVRSHLLVRCIVDENGKNIFTVDDVKALGEKSSKALDRLFEVARKLNLVSEADIEELKKSS